MNKKTLISNIFFVMICSLILLNQPLYIDESDYLLLSNRFLRDNQNLNTLQPQCEHWGTSLPNSHKMPAFIRSIYGELVTSPIHLRILGVMRGIISILLLLLIVKEVKRENHYTLQILFLSILSIGVLPLLLTMHRPEQELLIFTFSAIFLFLLKIKFPINFIQDICYRTIILFFTTMTLTAHPKSMFLIPIFLTCQLPTLKTDKTTFNKLLPTVLFIAITLIFLYLQFHFYQNRFACKNDPWIENIVSQFALQPRLLTENSQLFFTNLINNIWNFYSYFILILPLPMHEYWTGKPLEVYFYTSLVHLLFCFGLIIIFIRQALKGGKTLIKTEFNSNLSLLSYSVFISLIGISSLQSVKLFYESALIVPLSLLLVALHTRNIQIQLNKIYKMFLHISIIISFTHLTYLTQNANIKLTNSIPGTNNVPVRGWETVNMTILSLSKKCGINSTKNYTHALIDNYSFFSFPNISLPIQLRYIDNTDYWGKGIKDPKTLLLEKKSPWAIGDCKFFNERLRKSEHVFELEGFCCINFEN